MNYFEARAAGLPRYDGKPCKKGHGGLRYSGNHTCVECERLRASAKEESRSARSTARAVAILAHLARGPSDLHALRAALGVPEVTLLRLMRTLRSARQVYIKRWQRQVGRHASVWALGAKPDAPRLPPLSGAERKTALRARRKADIERHMDYRSRENGQRAVERAAPKRDPLTAALFGKTNQTRK